MHFLQIWLMPDEDGLPPRYDQKAFPAAEKAGRLRLVVSPDGRDGSLSVRVDAELYATKLEAGESVTHALKPGRLAWAQSSPAARPSTAPPSQPATASRSKTPTRRRSPRARAGRKCCCSIWRSEAEELSFYL